MCGIAGYSVKHPSTLAGPAVERLIAPLRSRGPDDEGVCLISRAEAVPRFYRSRRTANPAAQRLPDLDEAAAHPHDIALVNTRYAIIDLSAGGHQPFASGDGSVVAVFNGEIYNYLELRHELQRHGVRFRTASDTEVLVEGYRYWKDEVWNRLNGFWAVALYDLEERCLKLSRDRLGVAPLYYRETPDGLYFASSIRPLLRYGPQPPPMDRASVVGFIETELKDFDRRTCFADVHSLLPATTVRFDGGVFTVEAARSYRYWHYPSGHLRTSDLSLDEAVEQYRATFLSAVEIRLRADVNIAFELSGGLDSSSIVAAAAVLGHDPLTTYTIAVPEANEEPFARRILERYPVDYHVLSDPEETFSEDAAPFMEIMEEPFHAPNIYTHYRMRQRMKADGVDVVLSGSGGDEVLAGYEYDFWRAALTQLRHEGHTVHALLNDVIMKFKSPRRAADTLRYKVRFWGRRLHKLAGRLRPGSPSRATGAAADHPPADENRALSLHAGYPSLTYFEQRRYHLEIGLLPYYLRSNDHFTMSIPLEHRLPFLDYRMVELGLQLPLPYLFHRGWTKYLLRRAVDPWLPREIVWRREKMGFPFPFRRFLSGRQAELAPYLERAAAAAVVARGPGYDELLDADPLKLWRACCAGLWLEQSAAWH